MSTFNIQFIFDSLFKAKTSKEINDLLQFLDNHNDKVGWRNYNDEDNNEGGLRIGGKGPNAVIERLTNAIDAVLDRKWVENGNPDLSSPHEAAKQFFNLPDLETISRGDLKKASLRDIARLVQVECYDSGERKRPTFDFRDHGTGLESHEFPDTIFKLHSASKMTKYHASGMFGHGGSTVISSSKYTVVISRKMGTTNCTFSVVKHQRRADKRKLGSYQYLVDNKTNLPLVLDNINDSIFKEGTLVRHIEMNIGNYYQTQNNNAPWTLFNMYYPDPPLLYMFVDRRTKTINHRAIAGSNRLLTQNENEVVEHSHGGRQVVGEVNGVNYGVIDAKWWVLKDGSNTTIEQFVHYGKPIIITINGQRHGGLTNTIIKSKLGLPYLDHYLIVHVKCDGLDDEAKDELISSDRERLCNCEERDALEKAIETILAGDLKLKSINQKRQQKSIGKQSQSLQEISKNISKKIRLLLQKENKRNQPSVLLDTFDNGDDMSNGSNVQRATHSGGQTASNPITPQNPPTMLDINGRLEREVIIGRPFRLSFRTDADPNLFSSMLSVISNQATKTGESNISNNGNGYIILELTPNTNVGDVFDVSLKLQPTNGQTISSKMVTITVKNQTTTQCGTESCTNNPNVEVIDVNKDHDRWKEMQWDTNFVAEGILSNNDLIIYISIDNTHYCKLLSSDPVRKAGPQMVENIKNDYLLNLGTYVAKMYMDDENQSKKQPEPDADVNPNDSCSIDASITHDLELKRVSQLVLDNIQTWIVKS